MLGAVRDPGRGETTVVRLTYERGAEILRLGWSQGKITSTMIGPPYPSMTLLRPESPTSFVAYDLRRSQVTARASFREAEGDVWLTLELNGETIELSRVE